MAEKLEITVKAAPSSPRDSGTNIPQGVFARLGTRIGSLVDGWFGPGESLPPQAPPGTEPRAFDYAFGINMNTTRPFAPVPYEHLRGFARNYPLLRVAIERMKDRICAKGWTVRLKKMPDESPADYQARIKGDTTAAEIIKLLQKPDLENNWRKWLRKLLSDYLIIDAASIAVQRKNNGGVYRLMVVDGATIVRKVDIQGMTPMGVDAATGKPAVAYQQILKGIPAIDLAKKDLAYAAENIESDRLYGYSRVEQVVQWTVLGMNRLIHQTSYYTEGSVPDTFAFLPEDTTPEASEQWDALFQKMMSGKSEAKRKVWWMPWSGHEPVQMKSEDLTDKMDEMLNRFICFAFGISPSALVPQVNRASAFSMADDADEAGETPIAQWVIDTMNELVQSEFYFNHPELEFTFEDQPEVDHLVQAEIDQVYFAMADKSGNGLEVLNEFRDRDGLPHLEDNTPAPVTGPGGVDPVDPGIDNTAPPAPPAKVRRRKVSEPRAKGKVLTIDPGESTPAKAKAVKALAGVLHTFLAKQAEPTAKAVGAEYARQRKALGLTRRKAAELTEAEIESITNEIMKGLTLDWSPLADDVEALLQQAVTSGTSVAATALDAEHDIFAQANEWAIEYAEERAAELVGMKVVDGKLVVNPNPHWAITETTRDTIADIVTEALQDGDSPAMLKQTIREATLFSKSRAEMIATTEVNFANSGGQFEVAKLVGHTHKRSLLSGDHDLDDECDENAAAGEDGGIPLDEPFPDGSERSPFHPRCVCLTQTFVPGKEL